MAFMTTCMMLIMIHSFTHGDGDMDGLGVHGAAGTVACGGGTTLIIGVIGDGDPDGITLIGMATGGITDISHTEVEESETSEIVLTEAMEFVQTTLQTVETPADQLVLSVVEGPASHQEEI